MHDPTPHSRTTPRLLRIEGGESRIEREVDAELAFHVDMRVRRLVATGVDQDTARAQAMRQFGDWNAVRAECLDIDQQKERAVQRANYLAELRQDVGYAVRELRRNAGFALVVVLSLGLGIGANTAIFTLLDAVHLRPLPVPDADQLIAVGNTARVTGASDGSPRVDLFSYRLYEDVRDGTRLVTGLAATGRSGRLDVVVGDGSARAGGADDAEHPRGRLVSGNYFDVLGVQALAGRTLTPGDDRVPNGAAVAVLSHAYWQRRFAGDRSVVGRSIRINGTPFTVVGITPPGFHGEVVGGMTDIWMPVTMQPAIMHRNWLESRNDNWLLLIGRRAPHTTLAQARAGFNTIVHQAIDAAARNAGERRALSETVAVQSGARGLSRVRAVYTASIATLMGAVALVLLIVCANVANLLLARGAARARELGVRMALGAGRMRLVRQLLTESVILAALGGALGLLLAVLGSRTLLVLASGGPTPIPLDAELDSRVLAFAIVVTALTAVIFGLAPALRATRVEPSTTLRSSARGVVGGLLGGPGRLGLGKVLVMGQVALSLTLLVGTSMLVRSTRALAGVDTGLARDRLLIFTVDAAPTGLTGERLATASRTLLERLRRLPGVTAASFSVNGLFNGSDWDRTLQVAGFVARAPEDTTAFYDEVGPDYFATIGARLVQGRDIQASDDGTAPRVAVLNATMASFYFPGASAIGRRITVGDTAYDVIGVVADVKDHELRQSPVRRFYVPSAQGGPLPQLFRFELRTAGDPAGLVNAVRREIGAAQPSLLVLDNGPLTDLMRVSIGQDRLVAQVASVFAVLALALAALGLYGVLMYATTRRTSEFGLRMALGAEPTNIARMVLGEAMRLVAAGLLPGFGLIAAATRLIRHQLFGVPLVDVPSITVALVVLGASAAIAGCLPAIRAARVGPLEALRTD